MHIAIKTSHQSTQLPDAVRIDWEVMPEAVTVRSDSTIAAVGFEIMNERLHVMEEFIDLVCDCMCLLKRTWAAGKRMQPRREDVDLVARVVEFGILTGMAETKMNFSTDESRISVDVTGE